jgi:alkylated DNA repair dioxygenase AlkB
MAPLFGPDVPPGFSYCADFVTAATETALLTAITQVTFSTFEMRGVVARRRVAFFGASYSERPAAPIPEFLLPIRGAVAEWTRLAPDAFAMALINEFPPGAPIGWHRDASQYDVVAGLSLLSACEMRSVPTHDRVRHQRVGVAPRTPSRSSVARRT